MARYKVDITGINTKRWINNIVYVEHIVPMVYTFIPHSRITAFSPKCQYYFYFVIEGQKNSPAFKSLMIDFYFWKKETSFWVLFNK